MSTRLLILILAWITIASANARADSCTKDGAVCQGRPTYGFYNGKVYPGVVVSVGGDDSVGIKTDEGNLISVPRKDAADTHPGVCSGKACVGGKTVVHLKEGEFVYSTAEFAGVFPTGHVVAKEKDGKFASAKASEFFDGTRVDEQPDAYEKAVEKFLDMQDSVADVGPKGHPCEGENPGLMKLAAEANQAPLKHYLHTWRMSDENPKAGNPWRKCYNSHDWDEPLATDANGDLREDCAPDTLYTWGPAAKIKSLEQTIGKGDWWLKQTLFTTATPTGSFLYGDIPIRIKLKPGTKFKVIRGDATAGNPLQGDCTHMTDQQMLDTVLVRVFNDGSEVGLEYVLCSAGMIHSWSFGTRRHYDEMAKEVSYILDPANQKGNPEHGADYQTYLEDPSSHQPRYMGASIDGRTYSEQELAKNFSEMLHMSANSGGMIYVNPDSRSDDPTADVRKHFESKTKSYFHDEN